MNISKVFQILGEEYKDNFDKYKSEVYTLAEYCTIPFFSKEIAYKEVNNWGTEETTDIYLLFFPEGWKVGKLTVQTGAGINKIVDNNIEAVSERGIEIWFKKQTTADQMKMIAKAYQILEDAGKLEMLNE